MKKKVVISAVNILEGGALTILKSCIKAFSNTPENIELVLLLNPLIKDDFKNVKAKKIFFSYPKRNWLGRLFFEYIHCYLLSRKVRPGYWFSLHDMTPNVHNCKRVVYCHNPSMFYKPSLREIFFDFNFFLFSKFYKFIYQLNIHKNSLVVVQQNWIKEEFKKIFKIKKIITAYPNEKSDTGRNINLKANKSQFFYPSFPRIFKNHEYLLSEASKLEEEGYKFKLILTLDGKENKYSQYLVKKYAHLKNVNFIGLQKKDSIDEIYQQSEYVIFPSLLETWGLPISEAQAFRKKIICIDKPYAKETIGSYDQVAFFKNEKGNLFRVMRDSLNKKNVFKTYIHPSNASSKSYNWDQLIKEILSL